MKVMQCWDDSVANDRPLVELLRKHKAKATFNVIPKGNEWLFNDVYKVKPLSNDEKLKLYKGFKVAGHGGVRLDRMPPEQMRSELRAWKEWIRDFFGQEECGLAYPGGAFNEEIMEEVRKAGYRYARTTKNVDGDLPLDSPMALPSQCHFLSPDFWRKFKEVKAVDGVFYFWGHSYELMDDRKLWNGFEEKLARISSEPQVEWIDIIDLFV